MVVDATSGWTLGRLLALRARETGARELLCFQPLEDTEQPRRFTYREADDRATRAARGLLSMGLGPGDRIIVHLPNGPELLWTWFGAARAGIVIVPTNLRLADGELAYCREHSRAGLVVTTAELADRHAAAWGSTRIATATETLQRGSARDAATIPGADEQGGTPDGAADIAVLYTSGTTARPKGVRLTHGSYVWAAQRMAELQRLEPTDRHLVVNPLFHINAQTYSTMPVLWTGASMVLAERFSASRYWRWVDDHGVTAASVVTAMVRILLDADPSPDDSSHSLRWFGCAAINRALEERFGVATIGWYGMTETVTTPIATGWVGPRRNGFIGRVMPGYRARLVDAEGNEVGEAGGVGRGYIHGIPGRTLMRGYLFDDEATRRAVTPDGWLDTGDLLERDDTASFRFAGRAKDMFKVGGENVAAIEVESVLCRHPAVLEAAAIGVRDPILDQVVRAFVILRPGHGGDEETLRSFCRKHLADFKVPRRIELRGSLPRVTLGKIDKQALREEES